MQVIPAVDVLNGAVVRLRQGNYSEVTEYAADPVEAVRDWHAGGAELVHVVDLAGARQGEPDHALWAALGSAVVPFQLGGGLRTVTDVEGVIGAGASRAVVGTAAVWNPAVLETMVTVAGPEHLVVALDVRDGMAFGAGWLDEGRPMEEVLTGVEAAGLRHVLVTAIVRDGTMQGPDIGLLQSVAERASGLDVIASGGVGSLDDLARLASGGITAAIVGRALYEGQFTLAEAIEAAS